MSGTDSFDRAEALFHAALEKPAGEREAFLVSACGSDAALLGRVRRLLAADASPAALDSPAARLLSDDPTHSRTTASPVGQTLGQYQVLDLLGAGGMGEVYRARDTRLGRLVALKMLPERLAHEPDRLARLEREARALAALNHPNVAVLYGIEEQDARRFLVMELVEGPTLAERLASGSAPVPAPEALPILIQIAEALEAAHARGLVHRDLKPANVKLTPEARVKVLDFGLAKAVAEDARDEAAQTKSGVITGTPAYMSPEQARGEAVDPRSDIWSFGCVAFEMLSGTRPFGANSTAEILAAVLERDPDWKRLPNSVSGPLRLLLRRCLQKDPQARYESASALRSDLVRAASGLGLGSLPGLHSAGLLPVGPGRWGRRIAALAALIVAIAAGARFGRSSLTRESGLPRLTNPTQATTAIGLEDYATWSPDARTLAYESSESGNWDIWVGQPGGGQSVNRTADHVGDDRYPSWSPDGRQIAFWSDRDGGGYFVTPALGGTPRKVAATPGTIAAHHSPPAWSADGSALAHVSYSPAGPRLQASAEIVALATRESRRVALPGSQEARLDLAWSRDGSRLAYVEAATQVAETTRLWVVGASDGQSVALSDGRSNVRSPNWSPDGRYLYFVSNRAGTGDVWRLAAPADADAPDEPRQITTGIEIRHAAFSLDALRLAYSKGRAVSNVWRVPRRADRPATWSDAEQVTLDQAFVEFVDVSRDGRRLAVSSDRVGNQDLWVLPAGGGEMQQLTADPVPEWMPRWSPDGREIAFYSLRSGERKICVMPAAGGGPARQLTSGPGQDSGPEWSPDGREIAFFSLRSGNADIWVTSADGRALRQLTNDPAGDYSPTWSPDGQWLAFFSTRAGQPQIWRVPAAGGTPQALTRGPGQSPRWSPDGERVYYVVSGDRVDNLWSVSLKNGSERPATDLHGRRGNLGFHAPAVDARFLYFTWRDDLGDVWVMDVAQD